MVLSGSSASLGTPQFLVSTSGGVWIIQSDNSVVSSSENRPSSNTNRNSQPVRHARRKVAEVGWGDGGNERRSVDIQRGQPAIAVEHQRPFVRLVPMQFADAAGGEPHIHARDLF